MKSVNDVLWVSHRGESSIAPENTLTAFRMAREGGSGASECDVQLSRDGKLVVAHDGNTCRMGDRPMVIAESTWQELQQVVLEDARGCKERLCLLDEAIQELGEGRIFYIELKGDDPNLAPAVKAEVLRCGLPPSQCVFIAFSKAVIAQIKALMPEYQALWLMSLGDFPQVETLIDTLKELGVDGIDSFCCELPDLAERLAKLHDAGMTIAFWTVDTPGLARRLIAAGADAITSNCAGALRRLLSK